MGSKKSEKGKTKVSVQNGEKKEVKVSKREAKEKRAIDRRMVPVMMGAFVQALIEQAMVRSGNLRCCTLSLKSQKGGGKKK